MAIYLRGKYLRYRFRFAGKQIDESTKTTSKTIAREAERQHRRALEAGYNNFKELRENRVRVLQEIIDEYLVGYRLRYRSATFAEYALGHVARLLGTKLVGDITDSSVLHYQEDRLREKAAPKSINEEVRFLLKMLGDPGELIRAQLKKTKQLKLMVHKQIGKAFDGEESEKLTGNARKSRSPHMYPAFMLARNGGLRDTEIKTLSWGQINFDARTVKVGKAKSEAGEGRVVPLNLDVYEALVEHRAWYRKRFGEVREEWYIFPWGRPMPSDPTRHITSFKTAWKTMRKNAKVRGRWHDNRHRHCHRLFGAKPGYCCWPSCRPCHSQETGCERSIDCGRGQVAGASTSHRAPQTPQSISGGKAMFDSLPDLSGKLASTGYFIDPVMIQVVFLAAKLHKPLLLEGSAGSGKTQLALPARGGVGHAGELPGAACRSSLGRPHPSDR